MRKHVRAVLDDLHLNDLNKRTSLASGSFAAQQSRPAGSGGRGQVAWAARDKLVGQDGEGDGFLGVRVNPVFGAGDQIKGR